MIQETKEQQQMYNLFRSFIYIFLIIEFADDSQTGLLQFCGVV